MITHGKKGISLIVLVITILVMIILAGAVVIVLNNTGIISQANKATTDMNTANIKEAVEVAWADAYAAGARTTQELKAIMEKSLEDIELTDHTVRVTETGAKVSYTEGATGIVTVEAEKNEYGFFFNQPYAVNMYLGIDPEANNSITYLAVIFKENGAIDISLGGATIYGLSLRIPLTELLDILENKERMHVEYIDGGFIPVTTNYEDPENPVVTKGEPVYFTADGMALAIDSDADLPLDFKCEFGTCGNIVKDAVYAGYYKDSDTLTHQIKAVYSSDDVFTMYNERDGVTESIKAEILCDVGIVAKDREEDTESSSNVLNSLIAIVLQDGDHILIPVKEADGSGTTTAILKRVS